MFDSSLHRTLRFAVLHSLTDVQRIDVLLGERFDWESIPPMTEKQMLTE
jgi:hypothetical protein